MKVSDMGMMINRRRVMGGKNLPYDAEIEYLESSGTQWIDTEKSLGNNFEIETRFCCTQYTSQEQAIFSTWIAVYNYWNVYIRSNRRISLYVNRNNPTNNIVNTNIDYNLSIKRSENTYTLTFGDEVIVDTFGRNDNPTTLKLFTRGDTPSINFSNSHIKIYKCKVYIDDELVRDFIPVRNGNIGYMYDRVSRRFFSNRGTGAFILGPDKGTEEPVNINVKTHSRGTTDASLDVITGDGEPVNIYYRTVLELPWTNGYIQVTYASLNWQIYAVTSCLYDGQVYNSGELITNWRYDVVNNITIIANI